MSSGGSGPGLRGLGDLRRYTPDVPVDPVGFWGIPTASIDWCEQNYAVTPWVAEFWNTLSSLAMVAAGLVGLWTRRFAREVRLAFALLTLVGLGSIAFHGTLRFELQMLDELPMLYLVTWMAWLLVENRSGAAAGGVVPRSAGRRTCCSRRRARRSTGAAHSSWPST